MLRINNHKVNLDLSVRGFIALGKVGCPAHTHVLVETAQVVDRLYGREARGQHCDTCGAPLYVEVVDVKAVEVAAAG
jgi:hypothetical protein